MTRRRKGPSHQQAWYWPTGSLPEIALALTGRQDGKASIKICYTDCYLRDLIGSLRWRHKGLDSVSITSLTIVYLTVYQTQIKENIKAPRHWPLDRWIPRTNGLLCGKCFHLMTSSCVHRIDRRCIHILYQISLYQITSYQIKSNWNKKNVLCHITS